MNNKLQFDELDKNLWSVTLEDAREWNECRYLNVPSELVKFFSSFKTIETHDGKAWVISAENFQSTNDIYPFNDFEQLSLEAAETDLVWHNEIIKFWDVHIPVYLSVRNGYEYIAYNLQLNKFVEGKEPEFEETTVVASSISEFLTYINDQNKFYSTY